MKNKIISMTLAMVMCVGLLTGCGEKPNGVSSETKSSETAKAESESKQETKEQSKEEPQEVVNIVVNYNGTENQVGQKAVVDAMNEYSKEKIGVTITLNCITTDYVSKNSMSLATKEELDILWTNSANGVFEWAAEGALMDLTDLLPQYEDLYAVLPESVWESTLIDGKKYMVPNYKETGTGMTLATPKAMADQVKAKYGIDFNEIDVNTVFEFDKLEEYILACMELGAEVPLPANMVITNMFAADPVYERIDLPFVLNKDTGKVDLIFEIPEYRDYIELMISWNKKGIWKEEQITNFDYKPCIKSGLYAVQGWVTVPDNPINYKNSYGIEAYFNKVTDNYIQSASALGSGWGITAYSKKADACLKWLELLNTDTTFADMFVFGLEGVSYTRETNGTVTKIKDSGWTNSTWKATNIWVLSLLSTESPDKKDKYVEFNKSSIPSKVMGVRFNSEKVASELAAVKAVNKEFADLLNMGFYEIEQLDEVIKQCKAAGSDKVVAEYQAQLDAFLGK